MRSMVDKPGAKALGERIAQARAERGVSQADLARAIAVSRSAVTQWESGRSEPSSANLRRISEFLEVSIEWLSAGRGERAQHPMALNSSAEGELLDPKHLPPAARPLLALLTGSHQIWQLSTDKIAGAGYRRGDYLLVDLSAVPQAGDFVLAMQHQRPIFRIWFPPHLFAVPFGGAIPHITVDGVSCLIRGVIKARYSL